MCRFLRVSIGPLLETMSDAAVLDLFNRMIEAREKIAAGYDKVAVEIPPGRPQIGFSESSGQWVPSRQDLALPHRG